MVPKHASFAEDARTSLSYWQRGGRFSPAQCDASSTTHRAPCHNRNVIKRGETCTRLQLRYVQATNALRFRHTLSRTLVTPCTTGLAGCGKMSQDAEKRISDHDDAAPRCRSSWTASRRHVVRNNVATPAPTSAPVPACCTTRVDRVNGTTCHPTPTQNSTARHGTAQSCPTQQFCDTLCAALGEHARKPMSSKFHLATWPPWPLCCLRTRNMTHLTWHRMTECRCMRQCERGADVERPKGRAIGHSATCRRPTTR